MRFSTHSFPSHSHPQDISSESSVSHRATLQPDNAVPYTTSTVQLSHDDAFGYRMSEQDEAQVLLEDMAFLRSRKQSNVVRKQLQELYVGLHVNVYYDQFSLLDSMGDVPYEERSREAEASAASSSSTSTATSTATTAVDSAAESLENLRVSMSLRAMLYEEDADMPARGIYCIG